jgi:hypothetical protein
MCAAERRRGSECVQQGGGLLMMECVCVQLAGPRHIEDRVRPPPEKRELAFFYRQRLG